MSSKHSRHTPSPAPNSKLPKFLQKTRDRSKSVNDGALSSPEIPSTPSPSSSTRPSRKNARIAEELAEETPVIVEPVPIPSPRQQRSRPTGGSESTSPSRIGDLPTRLSGWFSHTFSTSSTDLSLPALLAQSSNSNSTSTGSSPRNRISGASALLTAAKHGKGHLDKAMRYLLDSDATPDKCTDPIWILGVMHPGYEPPQLVPQPPPSSYTGDGALGRKASVASVNSTSDQPHGHKRSRSRGQHVYQASASNSLSQSLPPSSSPSQSLSSSSSTATPSASIYNPALSTSTSSTVSKDPKPGGTNNWPEVFYADFTSRIWLTYRSHFPPIRDSSLQELTPPACEPLMGPNASIGMIQPTPASPSTHSTNSNVSRPSSRYTDSYKSDSSSFSTSFSNTSSSRGGHGPSQGLTSPSHSVSNSSTGRSKWNWAGMGGLGGEKGWTSDSGWGCMLRTGQSLLANTLLFMHLGREWRRPSYSSSSPHPSPNPNSNAFGGPEEFLASMTEKEKREYAMYVQIVTWFLDTPSEMAPFSVHRMALAGKDLGKDVGMWFGPSTAAGAIKVLVHAYPDAGLGVAVATDGLLTQTDVYAASHGASSGSSGYLSSSRRGKVPAHASWGDRPVLVLFGIRLGLEGVNPIYYDTIKMLYTFPQSVGIAGGRPSSSYYFVGSQTDNLFYLDPHHARPAIPLRPPPSPLSSTTLGAGEGSGSGFSTSASASTSRPRPSGSSSGYGTEDGGDERENEPGIRNTKDRVSSKKVNKHQARSSSGGSGGSVSSGSQQPGSPSSARTGSSFHVPLAPSPLQQQYSHTHTSPPPSGSSNRNGAYPIATSSGPGSVSPQPPYSRSSTNSPASVPSPSSDYMDYSEISGVGREYEQHLTPLEEHYATAYSTAELKTFHCDRVRKMPLSGLDPSMLIGFLCRDEKDWVDFRRRVGQLPKTIFSIQDEAPSWAADSGDNMALESMSDPDEMDTMELGDDDLDDDPSVEAGASVSSSRSRSASLSLSSASQHGLSSERSRSEEIDTEEDPVDPITPGPATTRFDSVVHVPLAGEVGEVGEGSERGHDREKSFIDEASDDIEDDWVEPSLPPTPVHSTPPAHGHAHSQSSADDGSPGVLVVSPGMKKSRSATSTTSKKKKPKKQLPVPVPKVRLPSPPTRELFQFPIATEDAFASASAEGPISTSYSSSSSISGAGEDTGGVGGVGAAIREKRMHNARARDGGRTQSGGVKGVLTDDW